MSDCTLDDLARTLARTRTRRSLIRGIAAGFLVATAGSIRRSDSAVAQSGNERFVLEYYDAIQRHAWKTAYNMLGAKFHKAQTLQQFIAGFAETAFTSVDIGQVTGQLSGNRYGVDVVINAWLADGTAQAFSGRYFVGREGGVAKIVDASIKVADASGLAPLCFADDLGIDLSGNAGTGHRFGNLVVTNRGGACTLAGMPNIAIEDQDGRKLISGKQEAGSSIVAVPVASGGSALLQLDWTNWCGARIAGDTSVIVSLPGSTGAFTVDHGFGVPPCLTEANGASHLSVRPWQPG